MSGLRLYSHPDCHLCEMAVALVHARGLSEQMVVVNIEEDDHLLNRYYLSVPVLQRVDSGAELFWPFDETELEDFLQEDAAPG